MKFYYDPILGLQYTHDELNTSETYNTLLFEKLTEHFTKQDWYMTLLKIEIEPRQNIK